MAVIGACAWRSLHYKLFIHTIFFRFDMMGKRLYKTYANLTNIVIRVSDGTSEGKEHAVLVSAHLDSTLPSPGAADDALSIGVMLDCIRVLTHSPGWTPSHAIIFCKRPISTVFLSRPEFGVVFNHGEESLQDASHLFSTQHPIAHTCVFALVSKEKVPYI
jgi:Zn-dependent M28 family amino/carboxypeptidase